MISIQKTMLFLWDILLFSMLTFPRILQTPKLAIIALIVICILSTRTKIQMEKYYSRFILLWLNFHILTSFVGIVYGNDLNLILANARFNLLLFGVLFLITNAVGQQEDCLNHTIKTAVFATIYIGAYNIIITVLAYTGRSIPLLLSLDATANVGIHIGYSHIVTTNMSMLILLFPFLLFLIPWVGTYKILRRKLLIASLLISGAAMILSGRRIIWLILGIALITFFFKTSKSPVKTARNIVIATLMIIGTYVVLQRSNAFSFDSVVTRFLSVFIRDESIGGEATRFNQLDELTKGFLSKPIFGNGAAAVTSYYRSGRILTTSLFEMSYNAVLFTGGIVGAFLYFGSLIYLGKYNNSGRTLDSNLTFATMGAYLCCVLANATNPYFSSSFDFLIMLFLPAVVSSCLIQSLQLK